MPKQTKNQRVQDALATLKSLMEDTQVVQPDGTSNGQTTVRNSNGEDVILTEDNYFTSAVPADTPCPEGYTVTKLRGISGKVHHTLKHSLAGATGKTITLDGEPITETTLGGISDGIIALESFLNGNEVGDLVDLRKRGSALMRTKTGRAERKVKN